MCQVRVLGPSEGRPHTDGGPGGVHLRHQSLRPGHQEEERVEPQVSHSDRQLQSHRPPQDLRSAGGWRGSVRVPGQHRGQAQQCLQCQSGQASGQFELILRLESYNDGPRFHNRVWDGQKVLFLPRDGNILPLYYRASSPQQALYYHIILL